VATLFVGWILRSEVHEPLIIFMHGARIVYTPKS